MGKESRGMSAENKLFIRLMIEILAGIGISVAANLIVITFGYKHFYRASLDSYNVHFFGIDVFDIVKEGSKGIGTPNIQNMMLIGIMCSVILVVICEIIINVKANKKQK